MAFYNPSTSLGSIKTPYITQPTVVFKIWSLLTCFWRDFDHQNLQGATESCDLIQMFMIFVDHIPAERKPLGFTILLPHNIADVYKKRILMNFLLHGFKKNSERGSSFSWAFMSQGMTSMLQPMDRIFLDIT